jgi:hypothetical protein
MKQALFIRVEAENYKQWRAVHEEGHLARLEYGITDGPVYQDEANPEIVLIQLNVESMERAQGWFGDERFRSAGQRAGKVSREVWVANLKE